MPDSLDDILGAQLEKPLEAATNDPRPRWRATFAEAAHRWLGDVYEQNSTVAAELLRSTLQTLVPALIEAFEGGRTEHGDRALAAAILHLQNQITFERREGRLKPTTPEGEISRCRSQLSAKLYRGNELDALLLILQPEEQIVTINFRVIKTSSRTISRQDLIERSMPRSQTNGRWHENFTSEQEISEAEQLRAYEARAAAGPKYGFNTDFGPTGVRR